MAAVAADIKSAPPQAAPAAATAAAAASSADASPPALPYYCTVIPGLEWFVIDELQTQLHATHCQVLPPGKVLFCSPAPFERVLALLSVEHVYYRVGCVDVKDVKLPEDDAGLAFLLNLSVFVRFLRVL